MLGVVPYRVRADRPVLGVSVRCGAIPVGVSPVPVGGKEKGHPWPNCNPSSGVVLQLSHILHVGVNGASVRVRGVRDPHLCYLPLHHGRSPGRASVLAESAANTAEGDVLILPRLQLTVRADVEPDGLTSARGIEAGEFLHALVVDDPVDIEDGPVLGAHRGGLHLIDHRRVLAFRDGGVGGVEGVVRLGVHEVIRVEHSVLPHFGCFD
jgi:hypothetical protein